jgi:hypothetical protein
MSIPYYVFYIFYVYQPNDKASGADIVVIQLRAIALILVTELGNRRENAAILDSANGKAIADYLSAA